MKAGTLEIEMITNVARLQKEMADMKRAVGGTMTDIVATAGRADRALASVGSGGMTRMGGSAKLAGHHIQNLVYQVNDVVVSLASGQKPMTVFMQQGSQIGQIAMQAGVGIGGMARALLGLAASAAAAALTNPYLLAAAAAAGIAFGAFKMFQSSVKQSGDLDRYAASLGLTAKEMKKLGPVGITVGDVMRGLWRTISDGLNLGPVFSILKDWGVWAFQKILEVGKISIAVIYAGWVGGFNAIKIVWQALPGVIGEAAVGAANLAIQGIEYLANKAVAALNWLASWVNPVLDRVGLATISQIENVALPRMENSFAGSTARMGASVRAEFTSAFGDAMTMMDAFSARWRENSLAGARDRLAAKAAEIKADRSDKAGKASAAHKATEAEKALKAAQEFAANLALETARIGKTPIEIKRLEVAMAALKAPTDASRIAILEAGQAWEETTRAFAASEFIRSTVAPLELQIALLGQSARAQALATLEAEREQIVLERGAAAWERYRAARIQMIAHDLGLKDQEAYLAGLDEMASQTQTAAQNMADAFGSVGGAIGGVAAEFARYAADQANATQRIADAERDYGRASFQYAAARTAQASAQINHYGNLASAAKGFFKTGSKGFQALEAAEKAFRAYELAIAIKNAAVKIGLIGGVTVAKVASDTTMAASDTARAAVEQGNSIITTGIKAVEAVVNAIRSLPFPLNIAAGAVTAGVIASLGIAIGGAFGGDGTKPAAANDGTGTIFGDSAAKSESIAKSIDHLREVDTLTMRYSAAMLASLRSIEANIGGLTNLIIRTNGGEASAAGIQPGFKPTGVTGILGSAIQGMGSILDKIPVIGGLLGGIVGAVGKLIGSLFGTKTSITGQGIYGGAQSLGGILAGGFQGQYYTDVQKKKKFLGITTSTRTSTQYSNASAELERQFSLIFTGFYDAISAAAGPLGLSLGEVQARLDSFVVNIGKIDLKGLTGQQIQEQLAAVFGAAADNLARYAIGGLEQFQKIGEGYFETLIRVASSVEALTSAMTMLGRSTHLTIAGAMDLVDLFGSVSDMVSATGEYFSLYYTNAEQAAARTAQMKKVLTSLGLAMPDSIAGFRALVEAQDLTTEAGRAAYVALIQLAPAFADLVGAAQDAASAAAIADERLSLQRRMLELQGDTATLRALDLAQLDASNRALQQQVWALEDQQKAAEDAANAAEKLRSAWAQITDGLIAEIKRIRGVMGTEPQSYARALAEFNNASMLARAGDQDAGKALPGLSQALLSVAANTARSGEDLARLQGLTAASLEQTLTIINQAAGANGVIDPAATSTVPGWWDQFAANQNAGASPAANDGQSALLDELQALRQEVSDLRDEQRIAAATIASGTSKTARILERVSPDGDALAVRSAA
ncbi:phage tail length tape measure family protein [Sphingosinicella microcystinivorans]|uniref:phage tail length tape measure family protein n=1 Tax=Sphingosinicella microcystinivorans TaxID=335406 RepID=UPI0022F3BF4C|nr:phage tail length tape measure family protein [Sphingosinicella microcystinivorans]WBX86333.1 phage tail length tape measure family protein [Sphingosinicella microcystinivorans]